MVKAEWVAEYLKSQENKWSPATLRSEKFRLRKILPYITGEPRELWEFITKEKYGGYSKVTIWLRCSNLWDWLIKTGKVQGDSGNPYKEFRTENPRFFKNMYKQKPSSLSFDECHERVLSIKDPKVRNKAMELLTSGLRYTESLNKEDGIIKGKGDKMRPFLGPINARDWDSSYFKFYFALRDVGLSPHNLRKAFASKLVEEGISSYDLCHIMGWNDIKTALCYVQTKTNNQMKHFIRKVVKDK